MHSFSNFIFVAEFAINVVDSEGRILWSFVGVIIAIERNVVHSIFFAFGRLTIIVEKLLIFLVADVFDVMNVKALLSRFFTISSHIKSADKLFLEVLRHFFQSFFFQLLDHFSMSVTVLHEGI